MGLPKLALAAAVLLFSLSAPLFAGDYTDEVTFSIEDLNILSDKGYDFVKMPGSMPSTQVGAPALPVIHRDVALPWEAEVLGVSVLKVETREIPGTFNVAPATAPQRVSGSDPGFDPYVKDPLVYGRDAFFPGTYVEHLVTWELVGQRLARLAFNPVQYNPVTGKLTLATRIKFRLLWTPASQPAPQPSFNLSALGQAHYKTLLARRALNPDRISIPVSGGAGTRTLPPGQYEHVIITPQTFENAWGDLVEWHTRKGYPDMVVTKEYIYANYSGSNQERIRSFVIDAHAAWGARFFLIGADGGSGGSEIPYHEKTFWSVDPDPVPNDTYYADYDGNYVVDVHVGRASVTSATEIGQFIDKVLYYERTPSMTDYGRNTFHAAFDLDDNTPGEDTKEYIRTNYIPGHINFITEYDSEPGSHLNDVIAYLDDGPNLVNHIDHCNWSVWGMGYVQHGGLMYDYHVNALTNGWKLINFYTLGCHASAWDHDLSLSEVFMRKVGGAGVSFTGNTRYGWYSPGHFDAASSLYDILWWKVIFADDQYHAGEALSAHKNEFYPNDSYYRYIFTELNLLGDPAMPFWTDDPALLDVTCDDPISTGAQSYTVNVQTGGTDLEGALVCLWKGDEVYERGNTDASGDAGFTIDPLTAGAMLVTVTAKDCLPHEGSVAVSAGGPPTVTDVTPGDGGTAGGTPCTITGTGFTTTPDTTVTFGGTGATGVAVVDASTITCTTPAHAAGDVDVTVTNSNGSDTLTDGFTYHDAPQVSGISPDHGTPLGGTDVTISGSDFTGVGTTTVAFDASPATGVTVVNDTTITCTAPAHTAGDVDVTVTNAFGSDTLTDGYTYNNPPSLTAITPEDGPVAGGTAVTISGSDFTTTGDTTVTIGGASAASVAVVNQSTITCTTPAHAAGDADVTVSNSNGSDTLPGAFTYHDAPQVSAVSPGNGTVAGGTAVTVTGSDFTDVGTTSVDFDGTPAGAVTVVNGTTLTCTAPAHSAGDVDVTVTNAFGSDTLMDAFTYHDAPQISGVSPSNGTVAGGTAVTITGSDFTGVGTTSVDFDGTPAAGVNVVNATTITCTTPVHAAGDADVTVTNAFGSDTLVDAFTYHDAPQISGISPDNGPVDGGTAVTITGSDFTGVGTTSVDFDGTPASGVNVVNATTITCTTPAHAAGDADVTVTNAFGSDTLPGAFTYNEPPVLSGITPGDGPVAGGTPVTISGSHFTNTADTTVTIGGASAVNVNVKNKSTITCATPAHAAGDVDVTVTNSNGSDTLPDAFTYHDAPQISAVSPDNGAVTGGTAVTVTGSAFTDVGSTAVDFDGAPAAGVTVVNGTTITCTTPAHAVGDVNVTVTNAFGSDTLVDAFTYNNPPVLSGINPVDGPVAGGTSVTITGNHFTTTADTQVTFGGASANGITVINQTTITCDTPAHASGDVDVTVTNSNGSDTLPDAFTYHDAPQLSGISPDNGPVSGGTAVTITGNAFTDVGITSVDFEGVPAGSVTVVNATTITCNTPGHAPGDVDVTVTNDFGSDTLLDAFTYNDPPVLSGVTPADGPVAGGTPVTITGNHFTTTAETQVSFGGTSANGIVVVNPTTITCTTPAHAAGDVDLTVTNSNGSDTLPDAFTYHDAPQISAVSPDNGPVTGGTAVTVTGSAFTDVGPTAVYLDGTLATGVTVVDENTITCTTPGHAPGPVDVEVANDFGNDTLVDAFTYNNPPVLSGVNPDVGPVAGGTAVTITGSHFTYTADTQVTFGGTSASGIMVVDANTITCDTPAHTAGDVDLTLTNSNGSDTLFNAFTYLNPPQISAVSPDSGPVAGGTAVTITGSDFTDVGTTSVEFDGIPANSVTVVSGTTITCVTPAHAAGDADVTVVNAFGSDTLPDGFTYNNPPVLSGIAPADGPVAGGTAVTITGSHFTFTTDTSVTFDGVSAANLSVVDESTITCETPAHAAGDVDVAVSNSNGSDTLVDGFAYHNPPQIFSVSPDHCFMAGGTTVTVMGSDFSESDQSVVIGGEEALNVVVIDSSTLTFETPAYPVPDLVDVEVVNPYGGDTLESCFEFLPPAGAAPMNLTDRDTMNLYPGEVVRLSITGDPGAAYGLFLSVAGGGPVKTGYGLMGLSFPIRLLWQMNLNANGYQTIPLEMPHLGVGYFNFYLHALVDDKPLIWAVGGNNPNGTGSMVWGLN